MVWWWSDDGLMMVWWWFNGFAWWFRMVFWSYFFDLKNHHLLAGCSWTPVVYMNPSNICQQHWKTSSIGVRRRPTNLPHGAWTSMFIHGPCLDFGGSLRPLSRSSRSGYFGEFNSSQICCPSLLFASDLVFLKSLYVEIGLPRLAFCLIISWMLSNIRWQSGQYVEEYDPRNRW